MTNVCTNSGGAELFSTPVSARWVTAPLEAIDVLAHVLGQLQVGSRGDTGTRVRPEFPKGTGRERDECHIVFHCDHDDDPQPTVASG